MWKPHFGICICHNQHRMLVVKAGFCAEGNYEQKQAKKKASGKKPSKSFASYGYKEPTGEAEVFLSVWEKSDQRCFVCKKPIPYPIASNFMHVLKKALNAFPKYKLYEPNIVLGCHDSETSCHHRYDKTPRSSLVEPMWKPLFELEAQLIAQYPEIK